MGCPSHVQLEGTLTFSVTAKSGGVATDPDSAPTYRIYEDITDPPIVTGTMSKLDDDDTTGFYSEKVTIDADDGFEANKTYTIYIAAVIGGETTTRDETFTVTGTGVSSVVSITPTTGTTAGDIDLLTFHDTLQSMKDADFGIGDDVNMRAAKRSVRKAYDSMLKQCNWKYLWSEWQLNVIGETTVSIQYDHTGHADGERMVTEQDGTTLPTTLSTNPTDFRLKIASNIYSVDQYVDADQFTLTSNSNPGADITTDTTATLYRNAYPLPDDFRNTGVLISPNSYWLHQFRPRHYVTEAERVVGLSGAPFFWSIIRDRNPGRPGGYSIFMAGYPSSAEKLHIWYKTGGKKPRLHGLETKTSVGTIDISGVTVSSNSGPTTFSSDMEGAILDVGTDATNVPTDVAGDYPPSERHRIRAVNSTTEIILYTTASTVTGKKYRVSDIIDFHPSMHDAFLRGCEHFFTKATRDAKNQQVTAWNYKDEVLDAMQEQVTYNGPRGPQWGWTSLTLDEPSGNSSVGSESAYSILT